MEIGSGYQHHLSITPTGDVRLGVIGRDRQTGGWCAFVLEMTWHEWETLNESAYNDREEVAQPRIC